MPPPDFCYFAILVFWYHVHCHQWVEFWYHIFHHSSWATKDSCNWASLWCWWPSHLCRPYSFAGSLYLDWSIKECTRPRLLSLQQFWSAILAPELPLGFTGSLLTTSSLYLFPPFNTAFFTPQQALAQGALPSNSLDGDLFLKIFFPATEKVDPKMRFWHWTNNWLPSEDDPIVIMGQLTPFSWGKD